MTTKRPDAPLSCYFDSESPFVSLCCGVPMIGDIEHKKTKCPHCDKPMEIGDENMCEVCGEVDSVEEPQVQWCIACDRRMCDDCEGGYSDESGDRWCVYCWETDVD